MTPDNQTAKLSDEADDLTIYWQQNRRTAVAAE